MNIAKIRKGLLLVVLLGCLLGSTCCYGQAWEWMKGAQNGQSHGLRVSTDINANIYATGLCWFNGQFGPYVFSAGSLASMPLLKYDSLGNIQWMILADSSASCGLTTDLFGNEYLLGMYWGDKVTFGGHVVINPHPDSTCYFIAKINSGGNVTWMKNVGNINAAFTYGYQLGNCLTTDKCGNIYAACTFIGNLTIGSNTFINSDTSNVSGDILIVKYDSSGNLIWAKKFGGEGHDWPSGIAITPNGNIYLAGLFKSDSLKFDATIIENTLISRNYWSMFLVKLDNSGNAIWAKTHMGAVSCETYGLACDKFENAFITGCYSVGYHPSAPVSFSSVTLPTVPSFQVYGFLLKYNDEGAVLWGKSIKGKYVIQYGATVDPCNNVWINGVNLDTPNAPVVDTIDGHILIAPAINDNPVFISGWTNAGIYIGASALASGANSDGQGITSDRSGNIYITTHTRINTFIVAGDSLYNTTGSGSPINMYVAKYNPNLGCPYDAVPVVNCKVSIEEIEGLRDISLYPNPTNTSCTITCTGIMSPNANIAIYDLTGRHMSTYPLTGNETTISIASLPPGMYICRIDADGSGVVSKKLVVMR